MFLVGFLVQHLIVHSVVSAFHHRGPVAQDFLVHRPVQEEYHLGSGDGFTVLQPLVCIRPGLRRAHAFLAHGPYVPEGDFLVLLEGLTEPLFLVIEFEPRHGTTCYI